jgi:dTDP-4-dehydrorhamnose reductase
MSDGKTILVTGANGQLGKSLQQVAQSFAGIRFHFLGRDHMPIEQFGMVRQVLETLRPSAVINAAAYTAVDKAEQETEAAMLANGEAVGHLAASCNAIGARFIHVSTDYVFDGTATDPYTEDVAVHPVNAYGASKLAGERAAFAAHADTVVVRTSWVYSQYGHNFLRTMLRLMDERPSINVVSDQYGCPTYAVDLADALLRIATSSHFEPGVFNYCNAGTTTWFEFACAIKQYAGLHCVVNPITTAEYPTPAKRPRWSVLDCGKISSVYGSELKPWRQSLQECIRVLQQHS